MTYIDAKRYLNKVRGAFLDAKEIEFEYAEKIYRLMPQGMRYDKEPVSVSASGDAIPTILADVYDDIYIRYNTQLGFARRMASQVVRNTSAMKNRKHVDIITRYFCSSKDAREVARDMGITLDYMYVLKQRAIKDYADSVS